MGWVENFQLIDTIYTKFFWKRRNLVNGSSTAPASESAVESENNAPSGAEPQPETETDKIDFHHRMMRSSNQPVVLRLTRYPDKGTMHLQMLNNYKSGELKTSSKQARLSAILLYLFYQ